MLSRHQEETQARALRLLTAFLLFPASQGLLAGKASHRSSSTAATTPSFVLSTQHERLSLDATNASLKAIVEQIGRELAIRVDAYVAEDERVTAQFDALPLEQAIKQLSDNYALFHDERSGKISRIAVFPEGEDPSRFLSEPATPSTAESSQPAQPEPFKFEFDPSKFVKQGR